jgi:hypothetical protein
VKSFKIEKIFTGTTKEKSRQAASNAAENNR